jgi:probable F420-dependent oxidoreductase
MEIAMRPFRFLAGFQAILDGPALAKTARRAESMGYSAIVIPDHLIEQLSPVPALAAIAAATTTLRIGTFVLNNELRHPAVLAQDLASVDVLSGGRLEIGLGAGWNRPEFDAIGLPFEAVDRRVGRLEESVAVLKGLFADGPFTFHGEHYTITDYDAQPKPAQRPHPPLLIGGGGRRTLTLAARDADIIGLAPRILTRAGSEPASEPASLTFAATQEKVGWVREAAGERFDDLELNVYPSTWPIVVTDDPRAEAARVIGHLSGRAEVDLTVDEILDSPHLFIGSIDGLVEKFQALRERLGISSIMVGEMDELGPVVERLAGT